MQNYTIVLVTNNYTPYAGGVVSSLLAFRQALVDLGHRVYLITLDFAGTRAAEDGVFRVYCPIKFLYKNNPMALPIKATEQVCEIIAQLKPDIVHSQHPFLLGIAAQRACHNLKIPLVFTHHTQYDKYAHYVPLPERVTVPVIKRLVHAYCKQCSLVLAPSVSIAQQLRAVGVKTPMHVLASPILPIFATALPAFVLKKHANKLQLLSVSRFVPEKNITVLLDAFAQLDNHMHTLTLVGYGYYQGMLERYAYGWLSLAHENVHFVVKPSKSELCAYYKNADVFVFASQSETQGLVLVEAMACGTPVVALRGPGQDDIIQNGVNGFLVDDVKQMCEALHLLARDHALFERLQQGAWLTGQQYRADILTAQLVEYYCRVLAKAVPE